jgi:4-alpha-glucanotransferase
MTLRQANSGEKEMQHYDDLIIELSGLCGITSEYWDIFGKKQMTSIESRKAVLRAMGMKIDTQEDITREIHKQNSRVWQNVVEPVYIVSANNQPIAIPVCIPITETDQSELMIVWSLEDEKGEKDEGRLSSEAIIVSEQKRIGSARYVKVYLRDFVRRDIGYYTLTLECRHPRRIFRGRHDKLCRQSKVLITPDACYIPPELENSRAWGVSINLYAIRSGRNWGAGDLTDLKDTVQWVAGLKGGFVGINPLHAIPNTMPFGVSPYSPISRLYRNFLYLDIEKVPEIAESGTLNKVISSGEFRSEIAGLRKKELIDYEGVASLKEKYLRKAFDLFFKKHFKSNTKRGRGFRQFIQKEGAPLESYSLFMALKEHMQKRRKAFVWQKWPAEYHDSNGKAARAFRKTHARSILFHQYVQWLIDGQLKEISENAEKLQMAVGLYHDLAVGSVGGGSDAWSYKDVIACEANVGAPPDDFSPDGQKWGFPPLIPERLKETGYELFISTIQKNMKYGGAIRIDHALGLFRVFWVPEDMTPKDGVYVNQPSEDLLRIIALESVRNKTVVIAEDLGTIGENVRETLKRFRMLSYRLFYFERNYPDPSFLPPERYPEMALCAVTTHDLPTIYGYWKGRDIEVRRKLGVYSDDLMQQQINDRERDKKLIIAALKSQGIIHGSPEEPGEIIPDMTPELCLAVYRYLSLTPCKLLLVSLDDVIGTLDQQNLPGTINVHPNWIQKTRMMLEEITGERRFTDLSRALKSLSGSI